MFGTTKLSTIRKQLEDAKASDRQIANAERQVEGTEVMEGLKLFMQRARKEMRRKRRAGAKK